MFKLSFQRPHRSIQSFEDITLPDFAVVTGANGAGKTHFLEAISNGCIAVNGGAISPNRPMMPGMGGGANIRIYNWTTFNPANSQPVSLDAQQRERDEKIMAIANLLRQARETFIASARAATRFANEDSFSRLLKEIKSRMAGPPETIEDEKATAGHLRTSVSALEGAIAVAFGNPAFEKTARDFAMQSGRHPIELDADELATLLPLVTDGDLFEHNLSQVFVAYYNAWESNRFAEFLHREDRAERTFLPQADFQSRYGEPPWDFVNRLLRASHLNYEVTSPKSRRGPPFEAQLHDRTTGAKVSFNDLSSGEKILMSFALCVYNASDSSRIVRYPQMLLLDEIDAPLHPSMARELIRVISQVLVTEKKIKVILSTHSPATVAFTPGESLYQLERSPRKLSPIPKEQAIEILTSGYISVTESSRFVLCEAKHDRHVYTEVAKSLFAAGHLEDAPKLVFVQASDDKNKIGGGREQVKQWGPKLADAGLPCILGLIDRDQDNQPTEGVKVLTRYSIENFLVDPIICYAVLVDHGHQSVINAEGVPNRKYHELVSFDDVKLQQIVDGFTGVVEQHHQELKQHVGTFDVPYVGGKKVKLPVWMRDVRGHDLVGFVREAFREEIDDKKFFLTNGECGELLEMMTLRLPEFIPCELLHTFRSLQEAARASS